MAARKAKVGRVILISSTEAVVPRQPSHVPGFHTKLFTGAKLPAQ